MNLNILLGTFRRTILSLIFLTLAPSSWASSSFVSGKDCMDFNLVEFMDSVKDLPMTSIGDLFLMDDFNIDNSLIRSQLEWFRLDSIVTRYTSLSAQINRIKSWNSKNEPNGKIFNYDFKFFLNGATIKVDQIMKIVTVDYRDKKYEFELVQNSCNSLEFVLKGKNLSGGISETTYSYQRMSPNSLKYSRTKKTFNADERLVDKTSWSRTRITYFGENTDIHLKPELAYALSNSVDKTVSASQDSLRRNRLIKSELGKQSNRRPISNEVQEILLILDELSKELSNQLAKTERYQRILVSDFIQPQYDKLIREHNWKEDFDIVIPSGLLAQLEKSRTLTSDLSDSVNRAINVINQ